MNPNALDPEEYALWSEDRAARVAQQYYCCDGRDCQCGGITNEQAEEEMEHGN